MDSQFITDKTKEANQQIRAVLEKFKEETGLVVSEITIDVINTSSKEGNNFMIGQIKLKLIA